MQINIFIFEGKDKLLLVNQCINKAITRVRIYIFIYTNRFCTSAETFKLFFMGYKNIMNYLINVYIVHTIDQTRRFFFFFRT